MQKIVMYEHIGSGNHGCEAIVRSTCEMLKGNKFYLQTFNKEEDMRYGVDKLAKLVELKEIPSEKSFFGIVNRIKCRLSKNQNYDVNERMYVHSNILKKYDIALSIGGDNYCYGYLAIALHGKMQLLKEKNIPTVLWGCSVDCKVLPQYAIDDLKNYHLITVRESLSYQSLLDAGIVDNVVLTVDPAFTLKRERVEWHDDIFENGNVVGVNVSDFMKLFNSYPDASYNNIKNLLKYILDNSEDYIALIPHVTSEGNDDRTPIKKLVEEINNPRVIAVTEDFNCMQLKDIIARCKVFVGCRTHSTIAAYSSCVPTLVVGYSIKAKGICKDLFGDEKDLLVDVRDFKTDDDLTECYKRFYVKKDDIKNHLEKIMPEYIQRAYVAKEKVEALLNGK